MTPVLDPELALRRLGALSTDLRSAAVAAADGTPLAGDAALAAAGGRLLDGAAPGQARTAPRGDGSLVAVRSASHLVAVHAGPHALPSLLVRDLLDALGDLSGD
jgi:hypothetical protein